MLDKTDFDENFFYQSFSKLSKKLFQVLALGLRENESFLTSVIQMKSLMDFPF